MRLLLDLLRPSSGRAADSRVRLSATVARGAPTRRVSAGRDADVPGSHWRRLPSVPRVGGPGRRQRLDSTRLCRRFDVSDVDLQAAHARLLARDEAQARPHPGADGRPAGRRSRRADVGPRSAHDRSVRRDHARARASSGRTTVLLSSHVLSEVERICGRIGLVRRGRLVAVQTLAELREITPRRLTIWFRRPVDREMPLPAGWSVVSRESAVLGDRRARTNRAVPGRAVGSGCGRPRDHAVRARGRDPARVRGASGVKALLWRAAERIRLLFAAVTAILVAVSGRARRRGGVVRHRVLRAAGRGDAAVHAARLWRRARVVRRNDGARVLRAAGHHAARPVRDLLGDRAGRRRRQPGWSISSSRGRCRGIG